MSRDQWRDSLPYDSYDADDSFVPAQSPGKRTLTMGLPPGRMAPAQPVQRKLDPNATIQMRRAQAAHSAHWMGIAARPDLVQYRRQAPVQRSGSGNNSDAIHQAAESGLQGSSVALPHLDTIQRSFGRHDVSGIDAHVGGPAKGANESMGATAYATGNSVAFKQNPDLHTAAHEAAHIVQQRQGVSLKGGVGQSGDAYEQHADSVADAVVRGESAEALLDTGPGAGPGASQSAPATQRKSESGQNQSQNQSQNQKQAGSSSSPTMDSLQFKGRNQVGDAVQFDNNGSTPAPSGQQAPSSGPTLQAGQYTQVQVAANIPIAAAPGLSIGVSLTGKYTQGTEGSNQFVEAEGVVRLSLSYRLLFLNLSVFLQGSLKFKVRGTTDWNTAFNKACEDVSHWVAARELANLPAKKQQVIGKYNTFDRSIRSQISTLRRESGRERYDQLRQESRPLLWWNNALANMVDARNTLVNDVRDIFSDMEGSINGNEVYPGTSWMRQQIRAHLDHQNIAGSELNAIRDALINESRQRKTNATTQMDNIPAIRNDPNVEFEANVQVGGSVGISVTENTSVNIEVARGWRIGDSMGDTSFNTDVQDVYTAAISVSGRLGNTNLQGQLAYEGVGGTMTSPNEFKISGQAMAGMQGQSEDPNAYASNLQGVKDRVVRAFSGARVGGQSALNAVSTALKREMAANRSAQWSASGGFMAGFDVEFKFKKEGGSYQTDGGAVKFVVVRSVGGSLGVMSGSIERGSYAGISW